MTARSTRLPLLVLVAMSVSPGASALLAQRPDTAARRVMRAESSGSALVRQLRRLQTRADSLARLYRETGELAERQRVGMELDATVDRIEPLLQRLAASEARSVFALQFNTSALAMTHARTAAPRGWLGIVVSGVGSEPRFENGEPTVRYLGYPEVVSVEPSSPAERAGLVPGDTLIAYDGRDVRNADLPGLLRPNRRLTVRIRRDGRTRDIPVTVGTAPWRVTVRHDERAADAPPERMEMLVPPGVPNVRYSTIAPRGARVPKEGVGTATFYGPSPGGAAPAAPPSPAGPPAPFIAPVPPMPPVSITFNLNGVAGAELGAVTEAWARMLGVTQGVLVLRAPAGSFAAQSGLRDADVIVRVNGQRVATVGQVRDLVKGASDAGERSVDLEVVRERRTTRLPLRW